MANKRVFISDLHIGDNRSMAPHPDMGYKHPYGWFDEKCAKRLHHFLDYLAHAGDIKELIILGDLFDQWVCPDRLDPVTDFYSIADSDLMKKYAIIDRFNSLPFPVHYTLGNHDMLFTKDAVKTIFPKFKFHGSGPFDSVFIADGIIAEHGNLYDLFNAPDKWSRKGSVLPEGFYIARIAADWDARFNKKANIRQTIKKILQDHIFKQDIPRVLLDGIAAVDGLSQNDLINMQGLDSIPGNISLNKIGATYKNIYKKWNKRWSHSVSHIEAILGNFGLYPAALSQFLLKNTAKIVIFGHTHERELHGLLHPGCDEYGKKIDFTDSHIYANCGTWISPVRHSTFIETELNTEKGTHHVRVIDYDFQDGKDQFSVYKHGHVPI